MELVKTTDKDITTLLTGKDLSDSHKLLVATLLENPYQAISVTVPDSTEEPELRSSLETCAAVKNRLERGGVRIKVLIGRLLAVYQKNPAHWRKYGATSFEDFIANHATKITGISRGELYNLKKTAIKWPSQSLATFEEIGASKLYYLVRKCDEADPKKEQWLKDAKELSYDAFKDKVLSNGIDQNDITRSNINIPASVTIKTEWQEFCADPLIRAYVGSDSPERILQSLMQECKGQWMAEANLAQRMDQ